MKSILELSPTEAAERLARYDTAFNEFRVVVPPPAYDIERMFDGQQVLRFVNAAVAQLQRDPTNKIAAIRCMREASGTIMDTESDRRLGLADSKYIVEAIMELIKPTPSQP